MKKKDTTSDDTSEWTSPPMGRITPLEVQQKEFQVARFGAGYRMRDVDEFLDQVTDALTALVAENERLVRASGDRDPTSSRPSTLPMSDDADRAAVEAFLRREKGFLQDLGGLVQEHAEELRSMVRAVRQDAPAAAAEASAQESDPNDEKEQVPGAASATGAVPAPEAVPAAEAADGSSEPREDTEEDSQAIVQQTTASPDDSADRGEDDDRKTVAGSATVITGAIADEPIRLDEPEPARSGRRDEEEDGSLRELFWGEE